MALNTMNIKLDPAAWRAIERLTKAVERHNRLQMNKMSMDQVDRMKRAEEAEQGKNDSADALVPLDLSAYADLDLAIHHAVGAAVACGSDEAAKDIAQQLVERVRRAGPIYG